MKLQISRNKWCEYCGKGKIFPHDKFCHECGHQVKFEPNCPKCGYLLKPQDKFCRECGTDVSRISPPKPQVL